MEANDAGKTRDMTWMSLSVWNREDFDQKIQGKQKDAEELGTKVCTSFGEYF